MSHKISDLARHITLRQLQLFECVARNQSYTKAAKELHLTQPTLSMQIRKLSESLEITLFEQIGRNVYLTEGGQVLLEGARAMLGNLSTIEDQVNSLKGLSGGKVTMCVVSTAQYFLPTVIKKFAALYPNIHVAMRVGNKEQLLERITGNKDDFYMLGQPPSGLNVESVQLVDNPLFFVANAEHELVGQSLTLADLTNETLLMREQGSGVRAHIEKVLAKRNFVPNKQIVLGGNEVIRLGLLENMGIAISSLPTLRQELERGEVRLLKVKGFPIERHWYLVYPTGKVLSTAARRFINVLEEESVNLTAYSHQIIAQNQQ